MALGDQEILFSKQTRSLVYFYGAFWPGLLDNWKPNYAAQPYTMFVTHTFLHTGLVHLLVNMIALWSLGVAVLRQVSQSNLILLYTVSALGGGIGFGLLAEDLRPMVGASGALFGLLGAVLAWEFADSRETREDFRNFAKVFLFLLALNAIYFWAMDGQLAWQAHLGGFIVGAAATFFMKRRPISQ